MTAADDPPDLAGTERPASTPADGTEGTDSAVGSDQTISAQDGGRTHASEWAGPSSAPAEDAVETDRPESERSAAAAPPHRTDAPPERDVQGDATGTAGRAAADAHGGQLDPTAELTGEADADVPDPADAPAGRAAEDACAGHLEPATVLAGEADADAPDQAGAPAGRAAVDAHGGQLDPAAELTGEVDADEAMDPARASGPLSMPVGDDASGRLTALVPPEAAAPSAPVSAGEAAQAHIVALEPVPAGVHEAQGPSGTSRADDALTDPDLLPEVVEAVLFVVDAPTSAVELAQGLGQPVTAVEAALRRLRADYDAGSRGLELREVAGGWRLYTREDLAPYVERFVLEGQQARLTQAALETLAVVAYRQPVTRSRVSAIRGVNVDGVMRTLLSRGLVEECGADPETGGGLYRTTSYFLEKMGLKSLAELPSLAPLLPDTSQLDDVGLST